MAAIKRLLLCSCEDTMQIDADSAATALGGVEVKTATRLCTGDIDVAAAALEQDGSTLIACGQLVYEHVSAIFSAWQRCPSLLFCVVGGCGVKVGVVGARIKYFEEPLIEGVDCCDCAKTEGRDHSD